MKNLMISRAYNAYVALALFMASPLAFAQEGDADLDVDVDLGGTETVTTTETWYTNPLYLIIGALVLLLLVAMIVRGGKKS